MEPLIEKENTKTVEENYYGRKEKNNHVWKIGQMGKEWT